MSAPRRDVPGRLWSLLDMQRFYALSFAVAYANLQGSETTIAMSALTADGEDSPSSAESIEQVTKFIADIESACSELPVSGSLREQIKRLKGRVQMANDAERHVLTALVQELRHNITNELVSHWFLMVPANRRALIEQKTPPFGPQVADAFSESSRDIAAAARCFALDEWTACVSHLMRALESPLQKFAARVNVTFPAPTDLENWKSIVDHMASKIEAEVKRLEGTPKSHERNDELKLLGDIALDFRHFKNAWRNGVAHGREWYDEQEAQRVYDAVKHFMQRMAAVTASAGGASA